MARTGFILNKTFHLYYNNLKFDNWMWEKTKSNQIVLIVEQVWSLNVPKVSAFWFYKCRSSDCSLTEQGNG